jgi:peptide deformylase
MIIKEINPLIDKKSIEMLGEIKQVDLTDISFLQSIRKDMFDCFNTIYKYICKDIVGLAGPQVGIPYNVLMIEKQSTKCICIYFNSSYKAIPKTDFVLSTEECLSLPNRTYSVKRFRSIEVHTHTPKYNMMSPTRKIKTISSETYYPNIDLGIMFQHEIDHCNGIFIDDIGRLKNA